MPLISVVNTCFVAVIYRDSKTDENFLYVNEPSGKISFPHVFKTSKETEEQTENRLMKTTLEYHNIKTSTNPNVQRFIKFNTNDGTLYYIYTLKEDVQINDN